MDEKVAKDRSRLNSLFSLIGLIILFVLLHWALWYYFEIEFDARKVLAETAAGGVIGVLYGVLPTLNKRFLQLKARRLLASRRVLAAMIGLCMSIVVFGVIVNRTEIRWPPGQADIELDGRRIGSDSWTEVAAHSASAYGLVFQTSDLRVGDFLQPLQFRPVIPLAYDVPEAAVFSSKPEYQQIVALLVLSFFQSTENKFLSDAKDRFASDQSKNFVDLNAIYQMLKLCFKMTRFAALPTELQCDGRAIILAGPTVIMSYISS
jgi:hypothetical protein